jgi:CDP-diacylglycerol--glycerol-3-phosphate 3-phosphatidyltransferase
MHRHVPNALTVVRIALVPVLVLALLLRTGGGDVLAAVVFCVASFTDGLDGWLARQHEIVSDLGKLLDPIADKLLIISSMVVLVSLDRLAAWVAMVVIAREFAVTVLRAAVGALRGVVIAASRFGKIKTVCQIAMVLVLILDHGRHPARAQHYPIWVHLVLYLTVAVTVASGAEYFWVAARRSDAREDGEAGLGPEGAVAPDRGSGAPEAAPGAPQAVAGAPEAAASDAPLAARSSQARRLV